MVYTAFRKEKGYVVSDNVLDGARSAGAGCGTVAVSPQVTPTAEASTTEDSSMMDSPGERWRKTLIALGGMLAVIGWMILALKWK